MHIHSSAIGWFLCLKSTLAFHPNGHVSSTLNIVFFWERGKPNFLYTVQKFAHNQQNDLLHFSSILFFLFPSIDGVTQHILIIMQVNSILSISKWVTHPNSYDFHYQMGLHPSNGNALNIRSL